MRLRDECGQRKYLNAAERTAFKQATTKQSRQARTFCLVLYYTGCRISEALALTPEHIDLEECVITFESLKKRKGGIFRSVPVPSSFIDILDLVHGLREMVPTQQNKRLWSWSRLPVPTADRYDCLP